MGKIYSMGINLSQTVIKWSFHVTNIGCSSLLFCLVLLQENLACHVVCNCTPSDLAYTCVSWLAESWSQTAHAGLEKCHPPCCISQDIMQIVPVPTASVCYRSTSTTLWHLGLLGSCLLTFEHCRILISYWQNTICLINMFKLCNEKQIECCQFHWYFKY